MGGLIRWKDDFAIGVEAIDNDHRKLFSIMAKISEILKEKDCEKNKYACIESIKFLKTYTVEHFAREEEYQKSIGYEGYKMHKKLHDNLRFVTLPGMEEDLIENDYDADSIKRFMGIFAAWLTGHICIEDYAISGKIQSMYNDNDRRNVWAVLESDFIRFSKDAFDYDMTIFDRHYSGQPIKNPFIYSMIYGKDKKEEVEIMLIAEQSIVFDVVYKLIGTRYNTINKDMLLSYVIIADSIADRILSVISPVERMEKLNHRMVEDYDLQTFYERRKPEHSMLFKTQEGYIGFNVIRLGQ